jgi:hypothetical protein
MATVPMLLKEHRKREPDGDWETVVPDEIKQIPLGHSFSCQHTESVCKDCIESWSQDWYIVRNDMTDLLWGGVDVEG